MSTGNEKDDPETGQSFTWVRGRNLEEVLKHRDEIESAAIRNQKAPTLTWQEKVKLDDSDDPACLICTL